MKKSILKKSKRINNKKGLSLLELIVAVMILMITIGSCLSALNLSYRSVLTGATKDDAQSLAQRDCDIVMSVISKQAENGTLDAHINDSVTYATFEDAFFENNVKPDTDIFAYAPAYVATQYDELKQHSASVNSLTDFSTDKKSRFLKLKKETTTLTDTESATNVTYDVYKISVIVYYGSTKGAYVTCEGEVSVEH